MKLFKKNVFIFETLGDVARKGGICGHMFIRKKKSYFDLLNTWLNFFGGVSGHPVFFGKFRPNDIFASSFFS